tara:strand:- start:55702 stop:55944 length:243 start_codon:yes stop_codon:yes gene_type:complete
MARGDSGRVWGFAIGFADQLGGGGLFSRKIRRKSQPQRLRRRRRVRRKWTKLQRKRQAVRRLSGRLLRIRYRYTAGGKRC